MAKKQQRFKINMSLNDFLNQVIDKADIQMDKDKEVITTKDNSKITLHKSLPK